MKSIYLLITILNFTHALLYAQEFPPVKPLRAEENYSALLQNDSLRNASFLNKLKTIPFNKNKTVFLSLGGEFRPRFELLKNKNWSSDPDADESYYSQRIMFHADLHAGNHIRFFGQIHHGLITLKEPLYTQSDKLDLHQGFVEISFPLKKSQLHLIGGRQELLYGSGRLVAMRDGLNIRRSFDMGRIIFETQGVNSQVFYGREVKVPNGIFDNNAAGAPYLWGIYNNLKTTKILGNTDVYYFGYNALKNKYNDGLNKETRHTIGIRRWGRLGKGFRYNTEIIYQFGSFGNKNISAFSIEGDWHYTFVNARFKPDAGIKLDYISGDRKTGDNKLGTFNPMFNNPAYFGLIGQVAAMNMFDIHPSFQLNFTPELTLIAESDFYWRAQLNDGLYAASRALLRPSSNSKSRWIGWQSGLKLDWEIRRYLKLSNETFYFAAGRFVKDTGEHNNTFYSAFTLWLGF